jgi:chorismate-pyruvate lyase
VAIDEVEKRVSDWLKLESSFTKILRDCIERRAALAPELQKNIDEALTELERIQAGM